MGSLGTNRLQLIHVALFTLGIVMGFVGLVLWIPLALIVGGVGLGAAGALTVAGWRIALRGPMGSILRHALGSGTIRRAEIVGVLWVIVGAAFAALGVSLMTGEPTTPSDPVHHAEAPAAPTTGCHRG